MQFQIIGEAHEGVCSVDEEIFMIVEADDSESAMHKFANTFVSRYNPQPKIRLVQGWNSWYINARKIWAKEI